MEGWETPVRMARQMLALFHMNRSTGMAVMRIQSMRPDSVNHNSTNSGQDHLGTFPGLHRQRNEEVHGLRTRPDQFASAGRINQPKAESLFTGALLTDQEKIFTHGIGMQNGPR